MSISDNSAFDDHESVHQFWDKASGLRAIIAIHSTVLGPAAGGCRFWHYEDDGLALTDVLRLSRGMTYKNALAGIPFGGGKCVVLADPARSKSASAFSALGRAVDSLGGNYITAEDVGVSTEDMEIVGKETQFVSGLPSSAEDAGGDPSPWTALGVALSIDAAVKKRLGRDSLDDTSVAVQGVGHVGYYLCQLLADAGAELVVADINQASVQRVVEEFGAKAVDPDKILDVKADVFAPCALGAILTPQTIPDLAFSVVAGAANNQLQSDNDARLLADNDILYAPDYVINSGGIICVAREYVGGFSSQQVSDEIHRIPKRLNSIFETAERTGKTTKTVADEMAESVFRNDAECLSFQAAATG